MNMDKEEILNNVLNLTSEELSGFISNGIVTLSELMSTDRLDSVKRNKIKQLQQENKRAEQDAWSKAEFGTEDDLLDYVRNFPNGEHKDEAKNLIRIQREKQAEKEKRKKYILSQIKEDPNSLSAVNISDFLEEKVITENDLLENGIPKQVIDQLDTEPIDFKMGETPLSIPEGYTEVYFWGIPGSGKTTALSAILSKAEREGNLEIATGPGYNYMFQLKNVFSDDYSVFPYRTSVEETQYLPFSIREGKNSKSISLIELSGEIFECFYNENAGKPQKTEKHKRTFDTLLNYLNSKNRKLHFFFIDYQKGNKKDTNTGLTQSDYLNAAKTYFENNKLFEKTADAIYVVLTKSDLMGLPRDEWVQGAKDHLEENNFKAFTNTLKNICRKNSINGKKLFIEPFSIGEVYFNNSCAFDDTSASRILEILKNRIPAKRNSITDIFNK